MKRSATIGLILIAAVLIPRFLSAQEIPPAVSSTTAAGGTTAPSPAPATPLFSFTPADALSGSPSLSAPPTAGFESTPAVKTTLPPLTNFPTKPLEWERWSGGLLVGVYRPSLDTLNHILSDPNVGILQDPNFLLPGNPAFPVTSRNIVAPNIFGLAEYGAEVVLNINPKYSLTLAFSQWSGESRAEDSATIFTRSNVAPSIVPRDARYNVAIKQTWLGLRYHFVNDPGRKKFFVNIGIAGISQADLTMDALERVITNNNLSFDSVSVTEASGIGFTTRFGLGGEYQIQKWISLGVNANYIIGKIPELKVTRYFANGFASNPPVPADSLPPNPTPIPSVQNNPNPGDTVTYAPMQTISDADYIGTPQNLVLDLDGFEIFVFIQFHL